MVRYFFHLRNGTDVTLDPEGRKLRDEEAVKIVALLSARETLSHDIKEGFIDLRLHIDVEDERGQLVHSLPMSSAFQSVGP